MGLRRAAALVAAAAAAAPAAAEAGPSLRLGHWNVYYKALDDAAGQRAVVGAIDNAAAATPFDIFSVVEASGDTIGKFPGWLNNSVALRGGGGMEYVSGVSGYETIALFYRPASWKLTWSQTGAIESGRPFIVALLEQQQTGEDLWVMNAHLPHYPQTKSVPGDALAAALQAGAKATGKDPRSTPLLILGDFNEFGECSLPPNPRCAKAWYQPATKGIAPLWDYLGAGVVVDAVPFNTTTCCTKWHVWPSGGVQGDDWWHHFDHIFHSAQTLSVSPPTFIPYTYPGTAAPCDDDVCTGGDPPGKVAPAAQGSWHRGWQATVAFK